MKIVLDANVVVAAFAARGLCESVFELCLGGHTLFISEPLLGEVRRNLAEKVKLDRRTVASIERLLRDNGMLLELAEVAVDACSDLKDLLHILGLSKAARAKYIVTGDVNPLSIKRFGRCRIATPRQLWTNLHRR